MNSQIDAAEAKVFRVLVTNTGEAPKIVCLSHNATSKIFMLNLLCLVNSKYICFRQSAPLVWNTSFMTHVIN